MFSTAQSVAAAVSTPMGDPRRWPRNLGHDSMRERTAWSWASAHLTVLPDLRVGLAAALDLLDQGSERLYGAGVDEGQTSP